MKRKRTITLLDVLIIVVLTIGVVWILYRIRVGLHYKWNWSVIPQYLFRFDPDKGRYVPNLLMHGFFITLKLSLWTMLLATILGAVMALMRLSKSLFRRMIARSYVELIRNMPPLVLVFILYYFVSDQILTFIGIEDLLVSLSPGMKQIMTYCCIAPSQFSVFSAALLTLVLYEGAYITEIIRAGVQSIDKGQWEASSALGLSWF